MAFSDNLKIIREKAGMSQEELADKVGISHTSIYAYEKGIRTPNFILGCQISRILNIPAEILADTTNKSTEV